MIILRLIRNIHFEKPSLSGFNFTYVSISVYARYIYVLNAKHLVRAAFLHWYLTMVMENVDISNKRHLDFWALDKYPFYQWAQSMRRWLSTFYVGRCGAHANKRRDVCSSTITENQLSGTISLLYKLSANRSLRIYLVLHLYKTHSAQPGTELPCVDQKVTFSFFGTMAHHSMYITTVHIFHDNQVSFIRRLRCETTVDLNASNKTLSCTPYMSNRRLK